MGLFLVYGDDFWIEEYADDILTHCGSCIQGIYT